MALVVWSGQGEEEEEKERRATGKGGVEGEAAIFQKRLRNARKARKGPIRESGDQQKKRTKQKKKKTRDGPKAAAHAWITTKNVKRIGRPAREVLGDHPRSGTFTGP